MKQRFLIRHSDGREYELSDVAYFQAEYEPNGFRIVDPAPTGYTVPEMPRPTRAKPERTIKSNTSTTVTIGAETPSEADA